MSTSPTYKLANHVSTEELSERLNAVLRPYWVYHKDMLEIPGTAMGDVMYQLLKGGAMNEYTKSDYSGLAFPKEGVSYGRLYRVPSLGDVTKKEAKREAKRLRRAAKAIEKAVR